MTPEDIWLATLSQIRLRVQRNIYDLWLRDAKFAAYDENTKVLTISVRNDYAKEWIQQKLMPVVMAELQTHDPAMSLQCVARQSSAVVVHPSEPSLVEENRAMAEKIRVLEMRLQQVEAENQIYKAAWDEPISPPLAPPHFVERGIASIPEGYILVNRAALIQVKDILMEGVHAKALIAMLAGVDVCTGMYRGTATELAQTIGRKESKSRTGWGTLIGGLESAGMIRRDGKAIDLRNFVGLQPTFLATGQNVGSQPTFEVKTGGESAEQMLVHSQQIAGENENVAVQPTNVGSQPTKAPISFFLLNKQKTSKNFGKKERPPANIIPLLAEMQRRLGYRPEFWQPALVELPEDHIRALIEKAEAEAVIDQSRGKSPAKLMYSMLKNGEIPDEAYFELARRRMS